MPISTNAPFNEFGQSMILRDIEQLYLALNGAGTGSPGDGQTQDQSAATSQDSGGVPDLSGLATTTYVDNAIAAIPSVSYPISIANGGTGQTTATLALTALGVGSVGRWNSIASVFVTELLSGSGTYTVPANVYSLWVAMVGGAGGTGPRPADENSGEYSVTSGGSVSKQFIRTYQAQPGGSGAIIFGCINVTPGQSLPYSIGAAGSHGSTGGIGTAGTDGGDTTLQVGSNTWVAGGGKAGYDWSGGGSGRGGIPVSNSFTDACVLMLRGIDAGSVTSDLRLSGEASWVDGAAPGGGLSNPRSSSTTAYGSSRAFSNTGGAIFLGGRATGF